MQRVKGCQREEKTETHLRFQLTGPCHGHKMEPFIRELRDTHYTLDPLPTALFHLSLPAPFGPLFCLFFSAVLFIPGLAFPRLQGPHHNHKKNAFMRSILFTLFTISFIPFTFITSSCSCFSSCSQSVWLKVVCRVHVQTMTRSFASSAYFFRFWFPVLLNPHFG